jgi:hypothetical protein
VSTLEILGTVTLALLGLFGGIFAVLKMTYKRGGEERAWATAIADNTDAARELASSFRDFKETTVAQLHQQSLDHERLVGRVAVMEEKMKGH